MLAIKIHIMHVIQNALFVHVGITTVRSPWELPTVTGTRGCGINV